VTPRKWSHPRPYDTDPFYSFLNRNKRSLSLDLRHAEARAIARGLAARADIVVENARTGVMESLGMGYEELRTLNPRLIYVSMPGFGRTGPEAQQVSYATVVEGMSGHVALNGYHDDPQPQRSGTNYADPAGGTAAAAAAIAALIERERTGLGQAIDLAQRDALATMVGDALVYQQVHGGPPPRTGNRHPAMAPHGIYPCAAGEGEAWVAIAVRDDREWVAFCREAGLAEDIAGLSTADRLADQDRLDAEVAAWTAVRPVEDIVAACDAAGIPVAPVHSARGLATDAHLEARGAWWEVSDPALARAMRVHALPWRFARRPARLRWAAPPFAAHNDAILGGELGMSAEVMAALEAKGAVGRRPRLPGEGD
jgi:crotonobetainyl-CoA:carnitine CoA-transferase CaiB-like acyl-CoA transferase